MKLSSPLIIILLILSVFSAIAFAELGRDRQPEEVCKKTVYTEQIYDIFDVPISRLNCTDASNVSCNGITIAEKKMLYRNITRERCDEISGLNVTFRGSLRNINFDEKGCWFKNDIVTCVKKDQYSPYRAENLKDKCREGEFCIQYDATSGRIISNRTNGYPISID